MARAGPRACCGESGSRAPRGRGLYARNEKWIPRSIRYWCWLATVAHFVSGALAAGRRHFRTTPTPYFQERARAMARSLSHSGRRAALILAGVLAFSGLAVGSATATDPSPSPSPHRFLGQPGTTP